MIYEQKWDVRIAEVDTKLNMKFTGILEAFQEAATLQFEDMGYGIRNRNKDSLAIIILDTVVNVKRIPKWNESITVKTWCNELDRIYCYRNFELIDDKNNVIVTGLYKIVLLDLDSRKIKRIDDKVKEDIKLEDKFLYDNNIEKIIIPEANGIETIQEIRNKDIDINGHVNNVSFVEIALNALSREQYKNLDKMNLKVCYKKECKNKDRVKCIVYEENDEYIIVIKSAEEDITHAIVKLY